MTASTDAGNHRVSILESVADLAQVRELWEAEQRHPLADHEFFLMIARVRSSTSQPLVLVLYRDERPVSLLIGRIDREERPVRFGYATLGRRLVKQLRFIVGGFLGETTFGAAALLVDDVARLMRTRSLAFAVFEQLSEACSLQQALLSRFGRFGQARIEGEARHWQLQLPARWDDFMSARSSKHRYWLNRLARVLDSDFANRWGVELFTTLDGADQFLRAADAVASRSYHRALGVGLRRDHEFAERVRLDAKRGRLRGYILSIDSQPRAFWYCIVYQGILHLLATAYDPEFERYEPGTVLLMRVFRDHCGTATCCVDFGLGDAGYKQRFGSNAALEGPTYAFAKSARGLGLRCLYAITQSLRGTAKGILDRAHLTQRLKTLWRRRLVHDMNGGATSPQNPSPSRTSTLP